MRKASTDMRARLALYHALLLGGVCVFWYLMTEPLLWSEEAARNTAFFFGKPLVVLEKTWEWFASGKIYVHLLITLVETLLAFAIGTACGLASVVVGTFADRVRAGRPVHQGHERDAARNTAPIFAVWFGLGILSKVALGITLVFFIVFFNVYQA